MAGDEGIEEARRRKLEELKAKQESGAAEEKLKAALRMALDDEGYERMMNVRVANSDMFVKAAQGCIGLYSRMGRKLGNKEVLLVLKSVKGQEKETSITFERK